MADALVFGAPNALANRLADILSDLIHVRERYQQTQEQTPEPGVAIVTTLHGLTTEPPLLVLADGARKDRKVDDPERRAWLATLAEGAARGCATMAITSADEAGRLKAYLKSAGLPTGQLLRRLLVIKQSAGQQFSEDVADALRLPRIAVDNPVGASETWTSVVADDDAWVVETEYAPAVQSLLDRADLVIRCDFAPPDAASAERPPLRERLLFGALKRTYAPVASPRLERDLSAVAHLTPILAIRNESERDAVVDALLRGAALPKRANT